MSLPPEIEKKLSLLEKENRTLRNETSSAKASSSTAKSVAYLMSILFLFAVVFIAWLWRDEGKLFGAEKSSAADTVYVEVEAELPIEKTSPWNKGLFFCVQIGAYKQVDLSLYSEKYTFFRYHLQDDLYKYTLGIFSTYEQAHDFRKEVQRLGLKDAFVQAIYNGEAIPIEKALEMKD
ncbi:MAG: SPOR domain-containing protein [Cryomorphaceae bacterium]|nr:SPOR domain-containing protein [Cryomorphaceae bacterium]